MKEPENLPSLDALGQEISRMHQKTAPKVRESGPQGAALAVQAGLELVCGTLVGAAIGFGLDKWLGTSPFLLVICFFLGAAGGFLTLYRTANAESETLEDKGDGTQ